MQTIKNTATYIFILIVLALSSCSQPTKQHKPVAQIDKKEETKVLKNFDPKIKYSILNIRKNNDYPSSMSDTTICKEWHLNEVEIKQIIEDAKTISSSDWHYLFDHLPCGIDAQLQQDNNEFDLSINGGAWFTIGSTDTTIMYGSFEEENNKFFLSSVWTAEDE